jgi:hypothetical protein
MAMLVVIVFFRNIIIIKTKNDDDNVRYCRLFSKLGANRLIGATNVPSDDFLKNILGIF